MPSPFKFGPLVNPLALVGYPYHQVKNELVDDGWQYWSGLEGIQFAEYIYCTCVTDHDDTTRNIFIRLTVKEEVMKVEIF